MRRILEMLKIHVRYEKESHLTPPTYIHNGLTFNTSAMIVLPDPPTFMHSS